jgi:hypothetical protein
MQAFLALFEYEAQPYLRRPRARGYPPRIFISYRRESPEDIAWCLRLAKGLIDNGYDVLLDELVLGRSVLEGATWTELARFMALTADSDVAIVVLSSGFVQGDRPNSMRNWIFEEWSRIDTLDDWGLLETVYVHRSGALGGESFVPEPGARSAYIDLREDPSDPGAVLEFFGTYEGPRLDPQARARLGAKAGEVVAATRGPKIDGIAALVSYLSIRDLAATEEHDIAEALTRFGNGERERARELALDVLQRNPSLPGGVLLAEMLWFADYDREAFAALAELSEGPSLWRHRMRALMGMILEAEGLVDSSLNQARWCIAATDNHNLGSFASSLGPAAIEEWKATVARLEPHAQPEARYECPMCGARYPVGWHACLYCGTTRPEGGPCGMCDGEPPFMEAPEERRFCGVCRKFEVEPGMWGNGYVVPREPGGRWSTLGWRSH